MLCPQQPPRQKLRVPRGWQIFWLRLLLPSQDGDFHFGFGQSDPQNPHFFKTSSAIRIVKCSSIIYPGFAVVFTRRVIQEPILLEVKVERSLILHKASASSLSNLSFHLLNELLLSMYQGPAFC